MDKKFVIGVIGAGRIGKIHIENLAHKIPNVKVKIIADVKIDEPLKQWAAEMGVLKVTQDANEIFKDPEIDVVVICSSTDTHAKFIIEAAKARKHIFCEKPIDTDLKRIKETLRVVKSSNVKLMIGFNRRFDHNFKRVRESVVSGLIGTPQIIKVTSRDPAPPPLEYIKVSGGLFMDMTIHDWDMVRYLAGDEVEEIFAYGGVLINPKFAKIDIDTAVAILKFKNGAMGIIDNSRQAVYGYDQRVEIFGSKGCAMADNDTPNTAHIYTADHTMSDKIPYFFLERYMGSYVSELQAFFDYLRNNKDPSPSGEDALKDNLIALAAKRSLDEHRPVKIEEVDK